MNTELHRPETYTPTPTPLGYPAGYQPQYFPPPNGIPIPLPDWSRIVWVPVIVPPDVYIGWPPQRIYAH